jgi:hypothetical protein
MLAWRSRAAAVSLLLMAAPIAAQDIQDGLSLGRQMLAQDNPGELWVERGARLFYEKRGP